MGENQDFGIYDQGSHFLVWINGELVFDLPRHEIYQPIRLKRVFDKATRSQIGGRGKRVEYRPDSNQRHPRY